MTSVRNQQLRFNMCQSNNSDTIFSYIMSKYFPPSKLYIKTTHSKPFMEINSLTKTPLFELQNPLNRLKFIYPFILFIKTWDHRFNISGLLLFRPFCSISGIQDSFMGFHLSLTTLQKDYYIANFQLFHTNKTNT